MYEEGTLIEGPSQVPPTHPLRWQFSGCSRGFRKTQSPPEEVSLCLRVVQVKSADVLEWSVANGDEPTPPTQKAVIRMGVKDMEESVLRAEPQVRSEGQSEKEEDGNPTSFTTIGLWLQLRPFQPFTFVLVPFDFLPVPEMLQAHGGPTEPTVL